WRQRYVGRPVELHEHEVPDLQEAPSFRTLNEIVRVEIHTRGIRPRAGRACRRTPVPGNLREVYIDLGARPARARVCHLPEVIALAESVDARVRQARELPPEIACIRIRVVDRGTQMLRIQPPFLGDELPGK